MMKRSLIEEMRAESERSEPLQAVTVRVPRMSYRAISEFALGHDLKLSVVLRRIMQEGWKVVSGEA